MDFHVSVRLDRLEAELDDIIRAGFQPEVRMTDIDHLMSLPLQRLTRIAERIRSHSFTVFTHGPFLGLDIASLNGFLARHSRECLLRGLEVTYALGGTVMVMHTNYSPFYSRGGLHDWLDNWSERMPVVVEEARRLGITLAIENTWEESPHVLERLVELLAKGVAVCLDVGHIATFSRLTVKRWWGVLGERTAALHLHDNDGLSDDHLAPGRGIVDFPALVGLVAVKNPLPLITLEVDLAEAIEGRRYLEPLFDEALRRRPR
jgi:sugar phosphate isomerase/epimerase